MDLPDPEITFREALNTGGGGVNALLRHAAAAYLNAAHDEGQIAMLMEPCVNYPLSTDEIVDIVNAALADGSTGAINDLKDVLAGYNELGADLDQFGRCEEDAAALLVTKASLVTQSFVESTAETSADASVTDAALALAGIDSSTSATTSSVEALDVVFDSVDGFDDLLLALPLGSDDEDDAVAEDQLSADDDAEDESFGSLDDVFELLSVA